MSSCSVRCDHETIQTAMTAAETGHLIPSSLHRQSAPQTRSAGSSTSSSHPSSIRSRCSSVDIRAVVSQQLVLAIDGHMVPWFRAHDHDTSPSAAMIRDNKHTRSMESSIHPGKDEMRSGQQPFAALPFRARSPPDRAALQANPKDYAAGKTVKGHCEKFFTFCSICLPGC